MDEDFTAIRDHFFDSLDAIGIDEDQVVMDNGKSKDVDESRIWVRFQIRPGENRERLIGGTTVIVTQIGQIILQVFGPNGSGSEDVYVIGNKFSNAFRKWISVSPTGHVRGYWSGYRMIGNDKEFQVNTSVYYESIRRYPR